MGLLVFCIVFWFFIPLTTSKNHNNCMECIEEGKVYCEFSELEEDGSCFEDIIPDMLYACSSVVTSLDKCKGADDYWYDDLQRKIEIPASELMLQNSGEGSEYEFPSFIENHDMCKMKVASLLDKLNFHTREAATIMQQLNRSTDNNSYLSRLISNLRADASILQLNISICKDEIRKSAREISICVENTNRKQSLFAALQSQIGSTQNVLDTYKEDLDRKGEELLGCRMLVDGAQESYSACYEELQLKESQYQICFDAVSALQGINMGFENQTLNDIPQVAALIEACNHRTQLAPMDYNTLITTVKVALIAYLVASLQWIAIFCCILKKQRNGIRVDSTDHEFPAQNVTPIRGQFFVPEDNGSEDADAEIEIV